MNTNLKLLLLLAGMALIASCSTTDSSREEYFGYSNSPRKNDVIVARENTGQTGNSQAQTWNNPLSNDGSNEYNASGGDNTDNTSGDQYSGYTDNNVVSPRYVPVIVPWWDRYYYDYYYYEPGYNIGFYSGGWWGWDWCWYSPWYSYHPFWGMSWYPHSYYYHWWADPYYYYPYPVTNVAYNNTHPRSRRTFSPYRQTYTGSRSYNSGPVASSSTGRSSYIPEKASTATYVPRSGNRSAFGASSVGRSIYQNGVRESTRSTGTRTYNRSTGSIPRSSGTNNSGRSGYTAPVPNRNATTVPRSNGGYSSPTYTAPHSGGSSGGNSGGGGGRSSGGGGGGRSSGGSGGGGRSGGGGGRR